MANTRAQQILNDIQYATLATSDNAGNPWNTPVFFAYDERHNIYWSSHPDSVHSQNIVSNGKTFIVIYNSKASEGEGVGLYIEASVSVLDETPDIKYALDLIGKRRGKPFEHIEKFQSNGMQRIFKATPVNCWLNDAEQDDDGDFVEDFRIPVDL